jgi:uncharacterized protein (TIGR03437 family)
LQKISASLSTVRGLAAAHHLGKPALRTVRQSEVFQMQSNKIRFARAVFAAFSAIVLSGIAITLHSPPAGAAQSREVRVVNTTAVAGQNVNVAIELVSLGNENALGFSLNFNPAILGNPSGALGSGANGATLNFNPQTASGRIGITLALSAGQSFTAGTRQIVVVTFAVAAGAAAGPTSISFGDAPVIREISDPNANVIAATYTPGTVAIQPPNPLPALTSLNPASVTAGSGGIILTVNGSNFLATSEVRWNGNPRTTAFVSSTQLTATIPATDLATAGTANVTVVNPLPGGGTSNGLTFTINNPAPDITNLSPNSTTVGGPGFTLTVNGSGFINGSTVQWNGSARITTFSSATQLTAAIPASDIAATGTTSVTVINPTPGGGTSNSQSFTINNPAPAITSLSPGATIAGSAGFTLTVNGTGFISGSVVQWNGGARTTSFVSATQLTAQIAAADVASVGTANVRVVNPAPGGGTSSAATFTISQTPTAQITIDPASPTVNDNIAIRLSGTWPDACVPQNPQLTVTGNDLRIDTSNSAPGCAAVLTNWSLNVPAGKLAAGTYTVRVIHTASSVQRQLGQQSFTVGNLAPTIASVSPSAAVAGGAAFTLTVNGANFINGSTVQWNGSARTTSFVSDTQLTAQISAADIATAGTASVTVVTPTPGGGTSNALSFAINGAVASVSAASFAGNELASESIVAAFGLNLATSIEIASATPLPTGLAGTKVLVKDSAGTERVSPLFFVAPGQVNYQMPPGTANGAATVTITSGDGKTSIGTQQIANVAPGLFTANANGLGVPAATVFRLKANGTTADEPLAQFDSTLGRFVPLPIDLGPDGDQVFVVLFGTGFRNNTGLANVGVKIGGTDVEVLYAGIAPGFVGLDQCNARVPRSLAGRGEVDLVMTVNGKVANTVRISIK